MAQTEVILNPDKNQYPVLIVIAGPAGSGKSTLCDRLVVERPDFKRVVTTTTRAQRIGEINGTHYHFIHPTDFRERITKDEFLEWAQVHGTGEDRLYGTQKSSIFGPLELGQNLVMNIDVQGVDAMRKVAQSEPRIQRAWCSVFILVDRDRLVSRIRGRSTESDDEIERRMQTAEAEMREAVKFHRIIESRTRDEDFAELLKIVEDTTVGVRLRYKEPILHVG